MPAQIGLLDGEFSVPVDPPPSVKIYALDTLETVTSNDTDIAGRALNIGGTYVNIGTNTANAIASAPPYHTGAAAATALYVATGVADQLGQEAELRVQYSSYGNNSCGLILQSEGDIATGDRYDCFISGTAPNKLRIHKYIDGVETLIAESVAGAATFFPINVTKTMLFGLYDNGDGTAELEVYVDDVLIVGGTDATPIDNDGRAGFRLRSSTKVYNFEHRSVISDGGTVIDTTAPTLSAAIDEANGTTASTASVTTNEANGTLYAVVTQSGTAPSGAQIKAGQNHASAAAVDSDSQAITTIGEKTFNFSGLTAGQSYWTHFYHEDAAGNGTVASADGFSTTSGFGLRSFVRSASPNTDANAYTPTMTTHAAGDTLVCLLGSDGSTTPSADGWTLIGSQLAIGSAARLNVFRMNAQAVNGSTPSPNFTTAALEQFTAAMFAFSGDSLLNVQCGFSSGSSVSVDAPNVNISGGPKDVIVIAAGVKDNSVSVSAYPAGFTNTGLVSNTGPGSCTLMTGTLGPSNLSSVNPGAFTVDDEQWAAGTIVVSA